MLSIRKNEVDFRVLSTVTEAWELISSRTSSDLSLGPRCIASLFNVLVDRMNHSADAPEHLITVLARLLVDPLEEITDDPTRRLYRVRTMVEPHKVREQDARCLQWLARQTGHTVMQKISSRPRILAVTRNSRLAKLENSFALALCKKLKPIVANYLDEVRNDEQGECGRNRLDMVRKLGKAIRGFIGFCDEQGLLEVRMLTRPNNVLLHERRYRRIWLGHSWLAEESSRHKALTAKLPHIWQELAAFFVAGVISGLDCTFVELGFVTHELEAQPNNGEPIWLGLWYRSSVEQLQKVRIELANDGQVVIWLLQMAGMAEGIKRFTISTKKSSGGDWIMSLEEVTHNGWGGLRDECDLLQLALSEWSGLNSIKRLSPIRHLKTNQTGYLRVGPLDINFATEDCHRSIPACAVRIMLGEIPGTASQLTLTGHEAGNYRMFYKSGPSFPGEQQCPDSMAGSWVIPGRFFHALMGHGTMLFSMPRELLLSAMGGGNVRWLVLARPHRISYTQQGRLFDALPTALERNLVIPQPVAIALACSDDNPEAFEEECWYGFLDLDSEFSDFALLQRKRFDLNVEGMGWLRYPAYAKNPPPKLCWTYEVAVIALQRAQITVSGINIGSVLAQIQGSALFELAMGSQNELFAWVWQPGCWRKVSIRHEDVSVALDNYACEVRQHVEKELDARKPFFPKRIIISGCVSAIPVVQSAFSGMPCQVELKATDLVFPGLAVFAKRLREKLPTYRDFIPDLKVKVCDSNGQAYWHSLFENGIKGLEAEVDKPLIGQEFEFELAANKSSFPLPLMSDGERAEENPIVRLSNPQPRDCQVSVHARYEATGRGLVLFLRSNIPGLMPPIELEWANLKAETSNDEPPALLPQPAISFVSEDLGELLRELKKVYALLGAKKDMALPNRLKCCLRRISDFFHKAVIASTVTEWHVGTNEAKDRMVSELIATLGFLLDLKGVDLISPVFPNGCNGFTRPHARVDLDHIVRNQALQLQIAICFRRFAAAAPNGFLEHCLTMIKNRQTPKDLREECVYSLGKCGCAWQHDGSRRNGIKMVFEVVSSLAAGDLNKPDNWKEFGCWTRSAVLFFAGNPWQIKEIPVHILVAFGRAMVTAIEKLTNSGCTNENAWQSILAALIYLRYTMHLAGVGPKLFGPKSDMAQDLMGVLITASQTASVKDAAKVGLNNFIEDPDILMGDTAFEKIANMWEGKAAGVLLRARIGDD